MCLHFVCGLYLNFSSESLHPTSAVNEEIETRGSNYIRITDDCVHLWRYIQLRMCVCVFVRERVRGRQKAGRWLYSDVRADLFGVYGQGEVKRGCWIDGGEIKGRFWACERMLMELMELRKPISSAWCPSWVMTWINNCWSSHESGLHTLRSHTYI